MATTHPANETTFPPRRSLRNRRTLALTLCAILLAWGWWYNEHRTIGWTDTFNPFYWQRRWHGDDLYDPQRALLLRGNHDLPEVALTFDDGPHPESRARILDILKQYGAKVTFFDVGDHLAAQPALVRRTLAEGHEIANHSTHHNRLPSLTPHERHREINDTDIIYYGLTGQHLTLLRPPGMQFNDAVLADTRQLGYIVVSYSTLSEDYNPSESPEGIATRSIRRTGNGSILLLHDYAGTAKALPAILAALTARGYRFVTISEMIAHLPQKAREAAQQFQKADPASCSAPGTPVP